MENATKALIIAGAVIITILVISLGVMVFNNYSASVSENSSLDEQEITEFNNQFTEYLGETVPGSQVNALIQLVRSVNQKASTEGTSKKVAIIGLVELSTENEFTGSTRVDTAGEYYIVTATGYTNGLISEIKIEQ